VRKTSKNMVQINFMDFDMFKLEIFYEYISLKISIFIEELVQPIIVVEGSIVIIVVHVVINAPNGRVNNENDNLEEFVIMRTRGFDSR
jgi:hypothetical protein